MGPNEILDKGFYATTAVGRFRAVRLTAIESCAVVNALDQAVLGFSQEEINADDSARGRAVNVRMLGITRAIAAGAITLFQPVGVDATGAVAAVTGAVGAPTVVIGRAMTPAGAAGDHIDLWLLPR